METLTRNPFTDSDLFDMVADTFQKGTIHRVISDYVNGALDMYWYIRQLDPYTNPVTKHELRAWLLDNGFDERETDDRIIKSYENKTTREKLAIVFYEGEPIDWHYSETMTEIEIRASKRNIHPFTLYAEIKLKHGTNNK